LGAIGWTYISSSRVSPRFHAQLERGLLLALAAAFPKRNTRRAASLLPS